MSDVIGIIDSWEGAVESEENKDYATAARLYRMCNVYYENGELESYKADVDQKGQEAYRKFWKMLKKLPKDVQRDIKREYAIAFPKVEPFLCDWRSFIREQIDIIYKSNN
jgi:hypothetical protein